MTNQAQALADALIERVETAFFEMISGDPDPVLTEGMKSRGLHWNYFSREWEQHR